MTTCGLPISRDSADTRCTEIATSSKTLQTIPIGKEDSSTTDKIARTD
jgi:hypothetical protein